MGQGLEGGVGLRRAFGLALGVRAQHIARIVPGEIGQHVDGPLHRPRHTEYLCLALGVAQVFRRPGQGAVGPQRQTELHALHTEAVGRDVGFRVGGQTLVIVVEGLQNHALSLPSRQSSTPLRSRARKKRGLMSAV